MKKYLIGLAVAGFLASGVASAASIIMEGDYVKTAVSDNGTLGYGAGTSPGILHDPTGTKNFGVDDYLTPGSPWQMFAVNSTQTGNRINNNTSPTSGGISKVSMTDLSGGSYDRYVRWNGTYGGYFNLQIDTFFNDGDERIQRRATLTALRDMNSVTFMTAIDPDPDVNRFGSFYTVNGRGAGGLAPSDWVHSEGTSTGRTLGIFSNSSVEHNTGVSSAWSSSASFYLAGTDNGNGDYTIGLAFRIGDLMAGDSVVLDYAYVMGDSIGSATGHTSTTPVPEPATMLLMGTGLAGLVARRRRKN